MPELPEVEAMRRGLQQAGVPGTTIRDVEFPRVPYKPIRVRPNRHALRTRLLGRRIVSVDRWGKAVMLLVEGNQRLVIEPRMTGLLLVARPADFRFVRMILQLSPGPIRTVYFWDRRGLGQIHLWSARQFEQRRDSAIRGPDALEITQSALYAALSDSRRPIKVALMDQKAVSGVGNLYASEILHRARIHPQKPCNQLTDDQWRMLHAAMRRVLAEAIRCGGSTLIDETYLTISGKPGRYQHRHRVYQQAGMKCRACRQGVIKKITLAQRSTFFCPVCQE